MPILAIVGASGHGKVIAEAALSGDYWDEVVFYDDAYPEKTQNSIWPIKGTTEDLLTDSNFIDGAVVGIGNNHIRKQKHELLLKSSVKLTTIIHPQSVVSRFAEIGLGTVIFAGAIVNPFAKIDESCVINTNAVVEHDCQIKSYVHLSPGTIVAGGVKIGTLTWLGIGSKVRELIKVTSEVIVGAGSVIVKNIETPGTYVGVPAKRLEK
jgi:sugar O-acyltransferase (sialic acid O-acetyltransferase NeuD family)